MAKSCCVAPDFRLAPAFGGEAETIRIQRHRVVGAGDGDLPLEFPVERGDHMLLRLNTRRHVGSDVPGLEKPGCEAVLRPSIRKRRR